MNIFNYWRPRHDSFMAPVECIPSEFLEAAGFVDLGSLSAALALPCGRPLYEGG